MKTEKLKVLRAFILDGSPTKVGDIVEVPYTFGVELRTAKKAERLPPPPEPAATAAEPAKPSVSSAAKSAKGEK